MQESDHPVLRVAIKRPFYKLLDYHCKIDPIPAIACRVRVPLGNTIVTALVVELNVTSSHANLKSIVEVLDETPLLDASMMSLLHWASRYYFYPLGEVLFHALPVALRKNRRVPKLLLWKSNKKVTNEALENLKRAPKQQEMLKLLMQSEHDAEQLQIVFGKSWRTLLRELEKKEFVEYREVDADFTPQQNRIANNDAVKQILTLTQEQSACVESIKQSIQEKQPKPILIHGVTGSGKTEVYLRSIEPILNAGKQVLVLVPEIGLTPQLLLRFKEHFPQFNIASLHSVLADGERMRVWLSAKSGTLDIIIGTRSAIFTPLKNLGLILIDEEHDASFKQQEGFLYQGRDMAIKRAHDASISIILGSATPSLETLQNAKLERFHYLRLAKRPGKSVQPEMLLQDTRSLPLEAGISSLMMKEIRQHLDNNNQTMLFLNRRGFAPVLMCPSCGWHATCQHCDTGMTYHASSRKVICHHCGTEETVNSNCPECKSSKLTTQGQGTERIEAVLNTHFPDTPVIRIDRDSTSRKGSLEKKLLQVHQGEPVILIGTQMLTKGHDFPNLTLVGILDVDQSLFSMDYRAQERLAQQILQVAGRAGRGERKGRVVLQTSQPEHPLLLNLLSQGYLKTAEQILIEREVWKYPPFGAQALIRVSADKPDAGMKFLSKLQQELSLIINNTSELLGPMSSPISKKAGRFRFQLLISSAQRGALHSSLEQALTLLMSFRRTGGVRWVIDVDPVDFS